MGLIASDLRNVAVGDKWRTLPFGRLRAQVTSERRRNDALDTVATASKDCYLCGATDMPRYCQSSHQATWEQCAFQTWRG